MSAAEFVRWMAFYKIDPWDEERADFRAATIAAIIANVNRGKGAKPFTEYDFMPHVPKEVKETIDSQRLSADIKKALGVIKK